MSNNAHPRTSDPRANDAGLRSSTLRIDDGGLDDPRVIALLAKHHAINHEVTPPESVHVFDLERLRAPDISFWSAWDGEQLVGVGALKRLDDAHGEVKSMHTVAEARRGGVGSALLAHIIASARAMGMRRLSLETGSFEFFRPAVALYAKFGFRECEPFGEYAPDPNSTFMTLDL
ncbi:MAG: GNAT family N-acetyltransferase [Polyangiales bacterium]